KIEEGNTFTWDYDVAAPTTAYFEVVHCYKKVDLTASVTLVPRPRHEPTVFFVTDRTVYRPGQPLHFAGFLRRLDGKGEFVPLPNETVEVHVTSERKKTVAGKLKLTSDAFGRIAGSYPFVEADALDTYTVSIPKY